MTTSKVAIYSAAPNWYLGFVPKTAVPGAEGFSVYLGHEIQRSVVFIGYRNPSVATGFIYAGTGFLVSIDGAGFLTTARHVAEPLSESPFAIRVNRRSRAEIMDCDQVKWYFHEDDAVDLAVTPLSLSMHDGYDALYQTLGHFIDDKAINKGYYGPGDICYTVGLFRFVQGMNQNLPMVHAGHIALLPPKGETIPVWNHEKKRLDNVDAYLIESHAIKGASGSPVVARPIVTVKEAKLDDGRTAVLQMPEARVGLLGLFQSAWFRPPDEALRDTIGGSPTDTVAVGVGVVVPATRIRELLESDALLPYREKAQQAEAARMAASIPTSAPAPSTTGDNPEHEVDFRNLVSAAARKRSQDD